MNKFPNLLSDASVYELAVAYWSEVCKNLLSDLGSLALWSEWLNVEFSDGTPFMDGNPIYSLVNRSEKSALKIIQVEVEQEGVVFDSWEDSIEIEGDVCRVLVIYCSISNEPQPEIIQTLENWFN